MGNSWNYRQPPLRCINVQLEDRSTLFKAQPPIGINRACSMTSRKSIFHLTSMGGEIY